MRLALSDVALDAESRRKHAIWLRRRRRRVIRLKSQSQLRAAENLERAASLSRSGSEWERHLGGSFVPERLPLPPDQAQERVA